MIESMMRMSMGDGLRCAALPTGFALIFAAMWLTEWLRRHHPVAIAKRKAHAIDSSNYRPGPHTHLIDFDRSTLAPQNDGSLLARCCVQECDCFVRIDARILGALVACENPLEMWRH